MDGVLIVLGAFALGFLACCSIWMRCPFCRTRIRRGHRQCPTCTGRFD